MGVDVSSTSVKMVELVDAGHGEPRVERYAIELLPRDAVVDGNMAALEAVAEAVRRCWKRMGTSTRFVAMAVPTSAVITKKIILPAGLREQEMEIQVESEANQYIPFALDEVNLDFQVIGPSPSSPDDVEVLLAASRKERVDDRVVVAELAELKPVVMDVEAFAIQSAYELVAKQLPQEGKGQIVALVDVGAVATKVTLLKDDQQLYVREQAFGGTQLTDEIMRAYGLGAEEAESLKRSGTPPDNYEAEVLHPFVENMAQEVARALQFFFTSSSYGEVHHIVMAGGAVLVPGVVDAIRARTNANVLLADPFAGMAIAPRIRARQLAADAPALMLACGLALRKFDQ
ncbi:MAG: pilus assembly protein PilM [Betaproteobacteria bacterium HGW-Betaproteobacteria-11]|nr:MAG: pilus assembly protein PilM [Betaproteobacteria bacterium HGW-Betaproteobacteria-11]